MSLDFSCPGSIPAAMNAQAEPEGLDPLFEQLLDVIESTLELCIDEQRHQHLDQIDDCCRRAAILSALALKLKP